MKIIAAVNKGVLKNVIQTAMINVAQRLEDEAKLIVDEYLDNLYAAIGTLPGNEPTIIAGSSWTALSMPYGQNKNFWYESGELEGSIVIMISETSSGMTVVAGVPADSPAYMEAVWNEFGFYPRNSHKLIRRPLFVPLAEEQLLKLNEILHERYSEVKLTLRFKAI